MRAVSTVSECSVWELPHEGEPGLPKAAAYACCHLVFTPGHALTKWNGRTSVVLPLFVLEWGIKGSGPYLNLSEVSMGCRLPVPFSCVLRCVVGFSDAWVLMVCLNSEL